MQRNIGFAAIPEQLEQDLIFSLVEALAETRDFSFCLGQGRGLPHQSFWQGVYPEPSLSEVASRFSRLDLSLLTEPVRCLGIEIWAERIVFLSTDKSPPIVRFHRTVHGEFGPLAARGSADPQTFLGITDGQRRSFEETGYPFTETPYGAYLPHFTLGHLTDPLPDPSERAEAEAELTEVWRKFLLPAVTFESFVAFEVLPKGVLDTAKIQSKRIIRSVNG